MASEGFESESLQKRPHMVLLNEAFYVKRIRPLLAEWALLWLSSEQVGHNYIGHNYIGRNYIGPLIYRP